MFDSMVLEVGVGLVLSYLLVALTLTSATEGAEAFRKTRARELEIAIGELLDDKAPVGAQPPGIVNPNAGLRVLLYRHPLIQALYRNSYEGGYFDRPGFWRCLTWAGLRDYLRAWCDGRVLPAYIPRETFAAALIDLMSAGPPPSATTLFKRGWLALVGVSAGDPAKMREEVACWYDAAMDRAGSRYKRRTHIKLFFAGLAIALLFNINSIVIAEALRAGDAGDRTRTIDAAKALLSAPASTPAQSGGPTPAPTPTPTPTSTEHQRAATPQLGVQTDAKGAPGTASDTKKSDTPVPPSPSAVALRAALEQAELPIGWDGSAWCVTRDLAVGGKDPSGACPAVSDTGKPKPALPYPLNAVLPWLLLVAGYLATAFAAMLGGPFWFDILGRFVNVRSALKPSPPSGK